MKMCKERFSYRKVATLGAVMAMVLVQSGGSSGAMRSPLVTVSYSDVDLRSEADALDAYVKDLNSFDRKCAELGKKAFLTREEFDSAQRTADDLKRRLARIQNLLRDTVRKLKEAKRWDGFDEAVLATIKDAKAQARFRQNSFKQTLEDATSRLTNDADEISSPLDGLRGKVGARLQDHFSQKGSPVLAWREVRVAYAPTLATFGLRCRLAVLRVGLSGAVHGSATQEAIHGEECACESSASRPSDCQ
jgi:hypothetical protein